ncbi:hypothetical protein F2Q70_00039299 [Brassica cretica]|uniref:Uncharacterized protein n=1 Tax=Brassica cretica TaxID=69181 RepID=A0A8S9K5R1_BRACR|nr:hypothetical protein F2Q70_00039299 [Brassica cretica]
MGGRTMKNKKKNNVGAEFLSLAPSQYQERSLEYRVHYRGVPEPFTKVRAVCDSELRDKGEASAREIQQPISFRLVAARVSLRMAPDACAATPRAPHVFQHGQDTCRTPPLLPDVRLHD